MTAAPVPGRAPDTLILTRRDIAGLMARSDWLEAVETGFRAVADGRAEAPPPMTIAGDGGAFHAKGARLRLDRLYVALKLNGNFPGNPERIGLPTIQGAILLCDGETGSPLAILDSIEVTLGRTAAASALAARFLARPESATICVCGCGEQGAAQLAALGEVLPLTRCLLWDVDGEKAHRLADRLNRAGGLRAEAVADLGPAAGISDVIALCTTSRRPYLPASFVRPGTFIAAVGADSPDKSEVEPALTAGALVVADVLAQCAAMGDLHHALAAGAMGEADVHAELHEIVAGTRAGRTSADQIILFDSTGTAVEDVACAIVIHRRARDAGGFAAIPLGACA
jgi:ornithine cyclodeaminase/alanine dehydrogenase-like protein (mu-crystallin family)